MNGTDENQNMPRCKYCPDIDNLVGICECTGRPNHICIDCYHRMVTIGDPRIYPDQSVPSCKQCHKPYQIFLPRCKQCDRLDNLVAMCNCQDEPGHICEECYLDLVTKHSSRIYPNHAVWPTCPHCQLQYDIFRPICKRCHCFDHLNSVCGCTGRALHTCNNCIYNIGKDTCPICGIPFRSNDHDVYDNQNVLDTNEVDQGAMDEQQNNNQDNSRGKGSQHERSRTNILNDRNRTFGQYLNHNTNTSLCQIGSIIVVLIALMIILTLLFWFVPIVKRYQVAIKYLWIVLMLILGLLLIVQVIILVKTYVYYNRREGLRLDQGVI